LVEQDYRRDVIFVGHSPDVVDGLGQRPLSHNVRVRLPITLSSSPIQTRFYHIISYHMLYYYRN